MSCLKDIFNGPDSKITCCPCSKSVHATESGVLSSSNVLARTSLPPTLSTPRCDIRDEENKSILRKSLRRSFEAISSSSDRGVPLQNEAPTIAPMLVPITRPIGMPLAAMAFIAPTKQSPRAPPEPSTSVICFMIKAVPTALSLRLVGFRFGPVQTRPQLRLLLQL